jgi:hypothetical protein
MSVAKIVYVNHWRDGSVLTVSSEDPQFPAQCTQDDHVTDIVWRTVSKSLSPNVVVDFGQAKTYDFIAVQGHNLSSGAVVKLYGADDDAISSNVVIDTLAYNGNSIYVRIGTARTKRYVKLSVVDSSNPDDYIEIGNVVVGQLVSLENRPFPNFPHGPIDSSEIQQSPNGADFTVVGKPTRWRWSYFFDGLSDSVADSINELNELCGVRKAWLLCLDDGTPNDNTNWLRSIQTNRPIKQGKNVHSWETGDLVEVL